MHPRNSRSQPGRLHIWSALLAATMLLPILSGCVLFEGPPREATGNAINEALRPHEPGPRATVDFGTVVKGDWDRMVVVCGGTSEQLTDVAGFPITQVDPGEAGFESALLFLDGDAVSDYFQVALDDAFVDHWYFTPCALPDNPGYIEVADLQLSLPRPRATLEFTFEDFGSSGYWYVQPGTLEARAADESP
jgi:hypothetical protein